MDIPSNAFLFVGSAPTTTCFINTCPSTALLPLRPRQLPLLPEVCSDPLLRLFLRRLCCSVRRGFRRANRLFAHQARPQDRPVPAGSTWCCLFQCGSYGWWKYEHARLIPLGKSRGLFGFCEFAARFYNNPRKSPPM